MDNVRLFRKAIKKGLIVAHVDVETSPYLSWHYPMYDMSIQPNQIEVPMQITSIGYMFEGHKKPVVEGWDFPKSNLAFLLKEKDKKLLAKVIPILNKADLVIGQNLDAYDVKKIQWRLCELGLPPIKNIVSIDILKQSRKVFSPPSHKLDYRSKAHGFGGKIPQDMNDCIDVAKGSTKKQKLRMKYNGKDVIDERKIFWKELPYYQLPKSIVKMLKEYTADPRPFCVKCASKRQKRFNVKKVRIKKQLKMKCNNCEFVWKIKK